MITDALKLSPLASEAADLLQVLGHPDRLLIICDLISGEQTADDLRERVGLNETELGDALKSLTGFRVIGEVEGKPGTYRLVDIQAAEIIDALCSAYLGEEFSNRARIPFRANRYLLPGAGKDAGGGI